MVRYAIPQHTVPEYDPGLWALTGDRNSPQHQWHLMLRRPVTLRDTPTFSRTFHYTNYFDWIGKLREISMRPAYSQWVQDLSSGTWGMVTNNSEMWVLGHAGPEDVVEGYLWLDKLSGQHNSTMEMMFDWYALRPNGSRDRIAMACMKATWVAITGHGTVQIKPFPPYFDGIAKAMLPPEPWAGATYPLHQVDRGQFGTLLAQRTQPPGPANRSMVCEHTYETNTLDSNLVGNVYFANYYTWQARTVDFWVQSLLPEAYRSPVGELRCVRTRVDHLREAMPFDHVLAKLSLGDVYERGVRFFTEFFRVTPDGKREKLGFGEYEGVWMRPDRAQWIPGHMPAPLRQALLKASESG